MAAVMMPYLTWTLLITLLITEIGTGLPAIKLENNDQNYYESDYSDLSESGDYSLDYFDVRQLSYVNNRFALFLYQAIADGSTKDNIFFSPMGISNALALTYLGANGNTSKQMREVIGFDSLGDSQLHRSFRELNAAIHSSLPQSCALRLANRMFAMEDASVSERFIADAKFYYNSTAENLNFLSSRRYARSRINSWVKGQTEGKIKNFIGRNELTTMTVLVLVNAIYFKADWENQFKKKQTDQNGLFHISHNTSIKIPMMHQVGRFPYGFDSVCQCDVIELAYSRKQVSMVIALPRDSETINGLSDLESQLTPETFQRWSTVTNIDQKLDLYLPKFSLNEDMNLDSVLEKMGMTDLFDVHKADLSGICDKNNHSTLYVSKVNHRACLDVDEEGSEASAATSVIMTGRSRGTDMHINRPFLFYIRHNPTGTILFLGKVTRPSIRRAKSSENNDVLDHEDKIELPINLPARRQPAMLGRQSRSRVGQLLGGHYY